jgi:hypothetical protein
MRWLEGRDSSAFVTLRRDKNPDTVVQSRASALRGPNQ